PTQQLCRIAEDPRVSDGAAGDPDAVDAGLLEHLDDILGRKDVATAPDAPVGVAILHILQKRSPRSAGVLLLHRPPVHADGDVAKLPGRLAQRPEAVLALA